MSFHLGFEQREAALRTELQRMESKRISDRLGGDAEGIIPSVAGNSTSVHCTISHVGERDRREQKSTVE